MQISIYYCWRDYSGFGLSAVVQAENEQHAIAILGWEIDEDTLSIEVKKIGTADTNVPTTLATATHVNGVKKHCKGA